MSIYIVTENNYFFIAIKEGLKPNIMTIRKLSPKKLENDSLAQFNQEDTFIFHTAEFGMELSFRISTGSFPGRLIFIPTTDNGNFKRAFNQYAILDTHATIEDIHAKISENTRQDDTDNEAIKDPLTQREKAILRHTINGLDAYTISKRLSISAKTVYAHRRSALRKLGGRNLFEIWPFKGKFHRAEAV
ncbi:transcriptional regulator FimZ [compost metagenome]|nr:helix-turn-helix transcriptional regulator [Serratia fonticola]